MMPVLPAASKRRVPNETDAQKLARAQELPKWIEQYVLQDSAGASPGPVGGDGLPNIQQRVDAWGWKQQFPVSYQWGYL